MAVAHEPDGKSNCSSIWSYLKIKRDQIIENIKEALTICRFSIRIFKSCLHLWKRNNYF